MSTSQLDSESQSDLSSRITIRLSPSTRAAIEQIQKMADISTIQDAIRRALSDELFLLKERHDGWKVLLKKDNVYREVQWADNL